MTFLTCRGPLEAGHPRAGVIYFCVDADIPLAASGMRKTPTLHNFQYTDKKAVLLEAHRAPDDWFATACSMPNIVLQGDPLAFRPKNANLFAAELAKCEEGSAQKKPKPMLHCMPTLTDSLPIASGKFVVLCGSFEVRDAVYNFLRKNGIQQGDAVLDRFGRLTYVTKKLHGTLLEVDGGRKVVRQEHVSQHLVVSPSNIKSGEYDTVIVMPDVPESLAKAVCRRVRYQIIGVMHSPFGYVA